MKKTNPNVSRRDFLKGSAAAGAAALLSGFAAHRAHAAGTGLLKVGLIGCGGRGKGAAKDCCDGAPDYVQIWALGDLWKEKAADSHEALKKTCGKNYAVAEERIFGGFDNYQKVLQSGVDLVLLATPPGYRPHHFEAAIQAGKHVFMEKPVCVDPWGYRKVCEVADLAAKKKLSVVAGTQRRHTPSYVETVRRIHEGAIGPVVAAQCYWIGKPVTHNRARKAGMSDIEWQISNWYAWSWTCGDHIVEQHIHNIDVVTWALGAVPTKAIGIGGRQARPEPGNIWDHFAVEFEYPGGVRVASYCSHFSGSANPRVSENIVGTKGTSSCNGKITGENAWSFEGKNVRGQMQEHTDLVDSIVGRGKYLNEGRQVADSSMCAVLGRMAAYTGREVSWKWATESSKLRLGPENFHAPGPYDAGPVPIPGVTELI